MCNKHRLLSLIIILIISISPVCFAEKSSEILKNIQDRFDTLSTLKVSISQTNIEFTSMSTTTYIGTLFYQTPDKLRIHYTKPTEQIIVYDGKYLWIYTAELKQVTKQNLQSVSLPIHLLPFIGAKNIDRNEFRKTYSIQLMKSELLSSITTYRIKFKPKNNVDKKPELIFWFNRITYLPVKTKIIDPSNVNITLTFSEFEPNIEFTTNLFALSIPPDCELTDLTSLNR
ncbi:MAG: outer membrane lipoprotein carrier protein LolA [bacterium]|nr:outer membrane lipoprotein carrier protein LolA [bacterium]